MIVRLTGQLIETRSSAVVIDVHGVGYELEVPTSTQYVMPELGSDVQLFVQMIVREDAQLLFGFSDSNQRSVFQSLIKISGVGPKVALAVLSTLTIDELLQVVQNEDSATLTRVPGIGAKTAQRMLVEMKHRFESDIHDTHIPTSNEHGKSNQRADAISALVALGYKPRDVNHAVSRLANDLSSEEMIKKALSELSRRVL